MEPLLPDVDEDIIFKSCKVQPYSHVHFLSPSPYTSSLCEDVEQQDSVFSQPAALKTERETYQTPYEGGRDMTQPREQPGAGVYTSPLTAYTVKQLPEVLATVRGMLTACQMPFIFESEKFKVL